MLADGSQRTLRGLLGWGVRVGGSWQQNMSMAHLELRGVHTTDELHELYPDHQMKVPEGAANSRNGSSGSSYRDYREIEGRPLGFWEVESGEDIDPSLGLIIQSASFGAEYTLGRPVQAVTCGRRPRWPNGKSPQGHFVVLGPVAS
jgi:hypothetical protein